MASRPVTEVSQADLHCHSLFSNDGRQDILTLARVAQRKGMHALAITDHNDQRSRHAIAGMRHHDSLKGLLLVPGIECSTTEGHMLGIGVREDVRTRVAPAEQADAIRAAGGVPVVSHPYRRINGLGEAAVRQIAPKLAALEVANARDPMQRHNRRARDLAKELGLGGTGGSDAHQGEEVGNCYTVVPGRLETLDQLLDALEKRSTWGEGKRTPGTVLVRQGAKNAWLWAKRGFRSI